MKVTDPTERMKICQACGFYNPIFLMCIKCGCFLIAKTKMKSQDCPEGKWVKEDEESLDNF